VRVADLVDIPCVQNFRAFVILPRVPAHNKRLDVFSEPFPSLLTEITSAKGDAVFFLYKITLTESYRDLFITM
jgi:hypothetical protein